MNKINEVLKTYISEDELEIVFSLPTTTNIQGLVNEIIKRYPKFSKTKKISESVTTTYAGNKRIRSYSKPVGTPTEYITKTRKQAATFSDGFKLKLAKETPVPPFVPGAEGVGAAITKREMQRFTMKIDNQWILELSSVTTEEQGKKPVSSIELEVEYSGITPPSAESVNWRINDIRRLLTDFGVVLAVDFASKLNYVYAIYKNEDPRSYRNFAPGIKGINNVITLKPHLWRDLLADPTNVVITDKIDGVRKIIYSDSNFIYIMNNKDDFIYFNYPTNFEFIVDAEEYKDPKTGELTYFIFDIYKFRGTKYYNKTFTERLDGITRVYEELKAIDLRALKSSAPGGAPRLPIRVAIKPFVALKGKYRELITEFVNGPKLYVTDGFIIIDDRKNISYKYKPENTVDFYVKHSPSEAPAGTPTGTHTGTPTGTPAGTPAGTPTGTSSEYILYCTTSLQYFNTMSLPEALLEDVPQGMLPDGTGPKGDRRVFPIPFISSLDSSVGVSTAVLEEEVYGEHDGKIAEFAWVGDYTGTAKGGHWKFLKFRTDRIVTDTYFGNYYNVAESNFSMDMINFDITEDTGGYFGVSNKESQKAVRHYTNLVMKKLLFDKIYGNLSSGDAPEGSLKEVSLASTLVGTPRATTNKLVLDFLKDPARDLGSRGKLLTSAAKGPRAFVAVDKSKFRLLDVSCGHGQDFNRYGDVELVFGIDIDKNAIIEMIDRRLESKTKLPLTLTAIADVTEPPEKTFSLLAEKHSLPEGYFTHSVCLLAFHYFCNNAHTMNNALAFISRSLQKGGKFGIILYDGKKILDLMGDKKMTSQFPFGEEMCLRKNYREYSKFGTKIGVRLPFSGNAFYEENVVVINDHLETFQRHNLYLEEVIPFEDHFDSPLFKVTDINDKNYLSLYQCVIFVKK